MLGFGLEQWLDGRLYTFEVRGTIGLVDADTRSSARTRRNEIVFFGLTVFP